MKSYLDNIDDIIDDPNEYVIITPVNFVYKANFSDLLEQHIESGADISVLYKPLAGDDLGEYLNAHELEITGKKDVRKISKYVGGPSNNLNMSLGTYLMSKKVFLRLLDFTKEYSVYMWMKDVINLLIERNELSVTAIPYEYPVFPILSIKSYFDSNMAMLKESNMTFFNDPNWPIYTRTNDSPPAIYIGEGNAQSALISNGCQIEGSVNESILGRNVKVGKGARVDNCIVMPGAVIGDGVYATGLIIDKDAHLINSKEVTAVSDTPYYVSRRETV
jgi:glucose-1-phosphate adenylyltransferase